MKRLPTKNHSFRQSIVTRYVDKWSDAMKKKNELTGGLFEETATIELPLTYSPQNTAIQYVPRVIESQNDVVEDDKYFVFNKKHKVRKMAFLKEILPDGEFKAMEQKESTTGQLLLSIDPVWFGRASDMEGGWTSWHSCFAPGGCYRQSSLEMATTVSIFMALITNSDRTKIIGRRWVVIPTSVNGGYAPLIAFLKAYGTFPLHYQRSLSDWIITNIFNSEKADWSISNEIDRNCSMLGGSTTNIYMGGIELRRDIQSYNATVYFDAPAVVCSEKDYNIDSPRYVFFNGIPSWEDDEDDDNDDNTWCCDHCEDDIPYDDEEGTSVWDSGNNEHVWCDDCVSRHAVWDRINDRYTIDDDAVSYYTAITSRIWQIAYTTAEDELEIVYVLDDDGVCTSDMYFFCATSHPAVFEDDDGDLCIFDRDLSLNETSMKEEYFAKREEEEQQ